MMLILAISMVIGIVLTGGCAQTQTIKDVSPKEAATLIENNQNNPGFVIIDVRTPPEFAEGYIENAVNIDFYSETFRDELNKLDKSQTYLIYCRTGGRSQNSARIMEELNFSKVYNILGGIIAWETAELPTVR